MQRVKKRNREQFIKGASVMLKVPADYLQAFKVQAEGYIRYEGKGLAKACKLAFADLVIYQSVAGS